MIDLNSPLSPEVRAAANEWSNQEQQEESMATSSNHEQESQVEESSVEEQQQPLAESNLEKNIRAMRESKLRAERERDEAFKLMQQYEQQLKQMQQPSVPQEDDDFALAPDDLAEGKHLSKMQKKVKQLQSEFKQFQQQSQESLIEAKIKAQYADFDTVVNSDNVNKLREQYPEIAQTIAASPDLYNKAIAAYTMIKKMGIKSDDYFSEDRMKATRNSVKPKPMASIAPQQGDSPLSKANAFANGLTDDLRQQLLKEMAQARKGL